MPTQKGNQPIASFVKGLITEATPLTFPENASLDEMNFELLLDGSRKRRLGLDYEDGYALIDPGVTADSLAEATQSCFYWPSPNGSRKVDIGVVQVGRFIYFLNLLTSNPSANVLNGGVPIESSVPNNSKWQFAIIKDYLIAVNAYLDTPYLVSYDDEADVISYRTGRIVIRDLYGVDDGLAITERPTTLSDLHKYNLRNQGWSTNIVTTCGTDVLDCTFTTLGIYPGNSDQWGIGRIGDLTSADVYKYDPSIATRNAVDGGQVPQGSFIIDLYNRGESRLANTGITLPADRETTFISTVAAYAGRVWYSGIQGKIVDGDDRSVHLNNAVLFSQVFDTYESLVRCHQASDPTSYTFSDVVDTDGGIIHIIGAVDIVKLLPIKHSLFVFARNGVWEITGGQDGFTATVFQVNKISSIGVFSPYSIVEANGVIYFWSVSGIYAITPNPNLSGVWDTNSVSMTTIQSLYNNIPDIIKRGAKGFYDAAANRVRWLFASDYGHVQGQPIDQPPLVIYPSIGTPVDIDFGRYTSYFDVTALDSETVVITAVTRPGAGGGAFGDIRGIVCKVDVTDNTITTIGSPTIIENVSSTYLNISTVKLEAGKFAVIAHEDTGKDVYCVVCTVSGTTILPTARQAISTTTVANIFTTTPSSRLEDNKFICGWEGNTGTTSSRSPRTVVVSVSGTTIAAATEVVLNDYPSQDTQIIASNSSNYTLYANVAVSGARKIVPISVSGSTITPGSLSDAITGYYTGSTENTIAPLKDTNIVLVATDNLSALFIAAVDLSAPAASQLKDTISISTISNLWPGSIRIISGYNGKFTVFYQNSTGMAYQNFEYSGGSITTVGSEVIIDAANTTSSNYYLQCTDEPIAGDVYGVVYPAVSGTPYPLKLFLYNTGNA
jgi:hypothetical protein